MRDVIYPYVLKNALDHKGSVHDKAVLGLVLRSHPDLKSQVKDVLGTIATCITSIEGWSEEQLHKELEKLAPELLVKEAKEVVKGLLKELKNAQKGKVTLRIAPSPSGALHIGHAYGASLNYEYAKMYEGKLILRIEDTNPENIYPGAYELIEADTQWLCEGNVSQVVIQSDRIERYYIHARTLVEQSDAYVCECDADTFRELKAKSEACPCRVLSLDEHKARYEKLFEGYSEGEAVLRMKTDIAHKNPAMRDFSLMRINEHKHPRTGTTYRVWPLMVLSVAIDDHELGVTHVLNGKDHTDNAKKEALIMQKLGWNAPEYQHWGRINFEGFSVSSSKTRLAIEQNEYHGWDDVRLPFLPALRRRGFMSGAIRKFAIGVGLSLSDKSVSQEEFWKQVHAFNRDLVEPEACRYFFVDAPELHDISGARDIKVHLAKHPSFSERGKRTLHGGAQLYLSGEDTLKEGKLYRLIDYTNIMLKDDSLEVVSDSYEEFRESDEKGATLHWLAAQDAVSARVLLRDGQEVEGLIEKSILDEDVGAIVQLERRYFARIEEKRDEFIKLVYLHT